MAAVGEQGFQQFFGRLLGVIAQGFILNGWIIHQLVEHRLVLGCFAQQELALGPGLDWIRGSHAARALPCER